MANFFEQFGPAIEATGVPGLSFSPLPSPTDALPLAIKNSAAQLGISPVDLATAIGYETAGTFDPWKKGPTTQWGTHRGLIQWGEPQAAQYGVTKDTPADEQMMAVTQYLKDRGVKPGMGLRDVYSTINAGRPGLYNASDRPGMTVDKHVNLMRNQFGPTAQAMVEPRNPQAPMTLGPSSDAVPSKPNFFAQFDAPQSKLEPQIPSVPLSGWTPSQVAELNSRQAPPEPSLGNKVRNAFVQSATDPVGALSDAAGKIYTKLGGSPAWGQRLGRDVGTAIEASGPVGAEFAPLGSIPKATEAAVSKEIVPSLPSGADLLKSGAAKINEAKANAAPIPVHDLQELSSTLDDAIPKFARRKSNNPEIDTDLYKNAAVLRQRFNELATEPSTLEDLHNLRQKLQVLLASPEKQNRSIGMAMRDHLDDFVFNHSGPEFGQGISEYARGAQSQDFQNIVEKAARKANGLYTGSGWDNAMTTELRNLANNPKRLRVFNPDAQEAIKKFAGGGSGAKRVAKAIGRFAARGPVSGVSDVVIGSLLHGIIPGGPIGVMAAGEIGRQVATQMGKNEIANIDELIRAGGTAELQKFKKLVSPQVYDSAVKKPGIRKALALWMKNPNATHVLAAGIASHVGNRNLTDQIEQQIKQIR